VAVAVGAAAVLAVVVAAVAVAVVMVVVVAAVALVGSRSGCYRSCLEFRCWRTPLSQRLRSPRSLRR